MVDAFVLVSATKVGSEVVVAAEAAGVEAAEAGAAVAVAGASERVGARSAVVFCGVCDVGGAAGWLSANGDGRVLRMRTDSLDVCAVFCPTIDNWKLTSEPVGEYTM